MSAKSRWQEYKEKNGVTPLDLIKSSSYTVNKEIINSRLDTCKNCDHFLEPIKQCLKCGCIMPLKVKLLQAKCPLDKW